VKISNASKKVIQKIPIVVKDIDFIWFYGFFIFPVLCREGRTGLHPVLDTGRL
jgi:hypothetical protein